MSTPALRPGSAEDARALLRVHKNAILTLGRPSYSAAECRSWAEGLGPDLYIQAMEQKGETYFVAELDHSIAGFCSFKQNQIIGLYVAPDRARQGIGSQLLRAAERAIARQGPKTITLTAALSTVCFYQFHGYHVTGTRRWTTRGGLVIDVSEMEKNLPQTH